jgi:hypothetical protein
MGSFQNSVPTIAQKSYSCMFGNILTGMAMSVVGVLCLMRMNGTDFLYRKLITIQRFSINFFIEGLQKKTI